MTTLFITLTSMLTYLPAEARIARARAPRLSPSGKILALLLAHDLQAVRAT